MDWDTTRHEVKKIVYLFCGGAVITVIVHAITYLCFGIMGERLTLRVREKMFTTILRNEIGWFDNMDNTSSMLASRLESDATLLRNVVVDRTTMLLQNVGLALKSFIIAFILNWRLTFVVLATYPLIVRGHISEKLFMNGYGGNLSKAYLKANMLAGEAVSKSELLQHSVPRRKCWIFMLNSFVSLPNVHLGVARLQGYFMESLIFFIFSCYGLALWYGSELMGKGLAIFKSVMKSFMILSVSALAMGEIVAMALDLLKGNQMVASVFEVLDRKTQVFGDVGENVAKVDGKDVKKLRLESLRKHIWLVPQEPALFATSIYENILYSKDGASESEVIEAAKFANAHCFISALPEGYSIKRCNFCSNENALAHKILIFHCSFFP
ncbi:OLC1v1031250C1 [Oldenlandia corymbosa var. corymbosa]|uniref:OLC1v1031250C1 n=1 Tax=Oldenlandia corymbosa var. corymbosa TaxID=529605 RepID=A0AAV1CK01_OLDCO|nr:OLC1v1031250C1 [Oldenlandia corymbosa var. corymbosa]